MSTLSIKSMSNQISKKKKKGFTLVELIIVIAIIAILAAIAIPKMGTVKGNANIKADIANAKNVHTAVAGALVDEKFTDEELKTAIPATNEKIQSRLDAYSKSKVTPGKDFDAVIKDGNIIIQVDGKEVYPTPEAPFVTK
ncbi:MULTISPECIES: prepilin-type N-terminal cleavage/methylation domain-containing protein [unclassified Clostridium]|uniref:prepilin-type N-terminal cleavage/methylation domain-containing protein n=1 Tax=unclassified Clostridium TaxID=2614128 RepID=UPI00257F1DCA|nr:MULTISPECIES: prepilin-type N-terminal cleavage/methylation domain-containing protein [unclassified Clostridium]MBN1053409.1 prepilin-type N-terminal cleavage/methylation domain-containing protein [Clostridium botulinum]